MKWKHHCPDRHERVVVDAVKLDAGAIRFLQAKPEFFHRGSIWQQAGKSLMNA